MQRLFDSVTTRARFAMQKVVGSSPIIRSSKPRLGGVFVCATWLGRRILSPSCPGADRGIDHVEVMGRAGALAA